MKEIIKVENLTTAYGSRIIHKRLSLTVKRGEILSILGGSGSGKSTLLKTLLLLKRPLEGRVYIYGVNAFAITEAERDALRRRMGVLFQAGALFSSITVGENITYVIRKKHKIPQNAACEMALFKLRLANLPEEVFNMYPDQLSGGMKKKAALARALALDPDVLFLDEPTSGLDPISADDFDRTISEINRLLGTTVVMITHDLASLRISHRVAVLSVGRMIYSGPVKGLFEVDDPWIKELVSGERGRRLLGGA